MLHVRASASAHAPQRHPGSRSAICSPQVVRCTELGVRGRPRTAVRSHSSAEGGVGGGALAGVSAAGVLGAAMVLMDAAMAGSAAAMGERVGEFEASGFVFKDSVELVAIDDPELPGVTLYVSDFKRSIVDKLAKDFFSEPSQASISCAVTGPVVPGPGFPGSLGGGEGKELFSESKGFNLFKNKTLRVRRVYDAKRNSVLYVAYSTRLTSAAGDGVSSGRYRTSLCAVSLPPLAAPAVSGP